MTTDTIRTAARPAFEDLAATVGRFASAFAAGVRASHEWRRLNARGDAELARQGLKREDIARAVMERHFA